MRPCFSDVNFTPVSLGGFLATDISGQDVLLATPASYFQESVQHFLFCKANSSAPTRLSVLVQANNPSFSKWRCFLQGMKRVSCPGISGHAFWVDNEVSTQGANSKLDSLENDTTCLMTFEGTASGTPASILVDSGASHCFIDAEFAQTHGFAHRPSKSLVTLADGQQASTTTKCNVRIRIQGHVSEIDCFVLDMAQQFDVMFGDMWLRKSKAILDFESQTCSLYKQGLRRTIRPVGSNQKQTTNSADVHKLLLNAVQLNRLRRQGFQQLL